MKFMVKLFPALLLLALLSISTLANETPPDPLGGFMVDTPIENPLEGSPEAPGAPEAPRVTTAATGEIIRNGGFEIPGNKPSRPAEWKVKRLRGDKRRCDKPNKTFAYSGSCAFRFKFNGDLIAVNRRLKQAARGSFGAANDVLTLTVYARAKSLTAGAVVTTKIIYAMDTPQTARIEIPAGTYDYQPLVAAVPLNGTATKIVTKIRVPATGTLLLDDVSVTIAAAGAAPVANDDSASTAQDTPLTIAAPGVLANDTVNGATITAFDATGTAGGSVTINADGGYTYTPAAGFTGTDTFTYTLTNTLGTDSAIVTVVVNPPAPIAADDAYETTSDVPLTITAPGVLANDTLNDATITASDTTGSAGGALALTANGGFTYTPAAGFSGTETFTYTLSNPTGSDTGTITFTVRPVPNAVDDAYTTLRDTVLTVAAPGVLANDTLNSATITAFDTTGTAGGTVTVNVDGSFDYTPAAGFTGTDTFTYTLTNTEGSDSATVTVTVNPPVPVAVDDDHGYLTRQGESLTITDGDVLANDTVNSATITAFDTLSVEGGSVTRDTNGDFVYTAPIKAGQTTPFTDAFTYTLSNVTGSDSATVTVTVNPPAPIAVDDSYSTLRDTPLNIAAPGVLGNDTLNGATITAFDATGTEGGTVTVNADGSFTYTPPTDFTGTDTFTYTLTNASTTDTATVSIVVNPQAPIAVDDPTAPTTFAVIQGETLALTTAQLLDNDTVNGATIIAFDAIGTAGGTITATAGGYSYTAPVTPGQFAVFTDTFTYTLTNVTASDTATVTITVNPPAPAAVDDDNYEVIQGQTLTVNAPGVLDNDTVNGATITAFDATSVENGTVALNANGGFTYTPRTNPIGAFEDTFTYTLSNVTGSDIATVTIMVKPPAPIAIDDSYNTALNVPLSISTPGVLGNDTVNTATITAFDAASAEGGTVALNPNGSFTYTPANGFLGSDTFTYTLTNVTGGDTATVTITVNQSPPDAANDTYAVAPHIGINVPAPGILGNDTMNGATITASSTTSTAGGTVTVNADGSFSYHPPAGQRNTADSFTYTLTNPSGDDTATVTLNLSDNTPIWFINGTAAAGGDGTLARPFNSVAAYNSATTSIGNWVFLYEGAYSGTLTLLNNQRVYGQAFDLASVVNWLPTHSAALPSTSINRPTVTSTSDAFILGNGNTIRAVDIGAVGTGSHAFTATTAGSLTIADVAKRGNGGVLRVTTSGSLNVTLESAEGTNLTVPGISVNGVTGSLTVDGAATLSGSAPSLVSLTNSVGATFDFDTIALTNTGGSGLIATNASGTSSLNIEGGSINASTLASDLALTSGLNLEKIAADVTLSTLTSINPKNVGLRLVEVTGTGVTITGTTTIDNATGRSIFINFGTAPINIGGGTTPAAVDITSRNSVAMGISNGSGTVTFGNVNIPNPDNTTGDVVLLDNTAKTITFASLNINNAREDVFQLSNATGAVTINGGTINNVASNLFEIANGRNITLNGVTVTNVTKAAFVGSQAQNITVRNATFTNVGSAQFDHVFAFSDITTAASPNLTGTLIIEDSRFEDMAHDAVSVENYTGTLDIQVRRSDFVDSINKGTFGGKGIFATADASGGSAPTISVTVDDVDFTELDGAGVEVNSEGTNGATTNVTVQGSRFTPRFYQSGSLLNGFNAVHLSTSGNGTVNFDITGNTMTGYEGNHIVVLPEGTGAAMTGKIMNNTLDFSGAGGGIRVIADPTTPTDTYNVRVRIQGNMLSRMESIGIEVINQDASPSAVLDVALLNNIVPASTTITSTGVSGIRVTGRDTTTTCLVIQNNNATGKNGAVGISVRQANSGVFNIQGLTGSPSAYINANNTSSPAAFTTGTFTSVANCTADEIP